MAAILKLFVCLVEVLLIVKVVFAVILPYLSDRYCDAAACYFIRHAMKYYFHGHLLADVYAKHFFPRYRHFVDYGFCYMTAALSMLAFRDNRTSRIVLAVSDGYWHSWMEFRHFGTWWVIDPTWKSSCIQLRAKTYIEYRPKIKYVCKYKEFWQYPISAQFESKLSRPETSHLLYELQRIYAHYEGQPKPFCPDIKGMALEEKDGYHLNPRVYFLMPEVIFSQRIFNQFMAKPNRLQPKARTARRVKSYQAYLQRDFAAWQAAHSKTTHHTTY